MCIWTKSWWIENVYDSVSVFAHAYQQGCVTLRQVLNGFNHSTVTNSTSIDRWTQTPTFGINYFGILSVAFGIFEYSSESIQLNRSYFLHSFYTKLLRVVWISNFRVCCERRSGKSTIDLYSVEIEDIFVPVKRKCLGETESSTQNYVRIFHAARPS